MDTMHSEIEQYLDALRRDACYVVEKVLKTSVYEATEVVYFVGENGSKQGPMIRKRFAAMPGGGPGMGKAYERIWKIQREGKRFLYIPHIFEYYSTEDSNVVIMEYVSGETLSDLIYRLDPSPQLACKVFPDICAAVIELHECFDTPLIHRDLKPSNVMISRSGAVTLIDFGIARVFDESAETDTYHFGTRSYAPPEQFGFGQTSVRSDVYALGMLLYYCLTERNPTPSMAGTDFEDVPVVFRPILSKATAFDPKDRFASAADLRDAFCEAAKAFRTGENETRPNGARPNELQPNEMQLNEMRLIELRPNEAQLGEIQSNKVRQVASESDAAMFHVKHSEPTKVENNALLRSDVETELPRRSDFSVQNAAALTSPDRYIAVYGARSDETQIYHSENDGENGREIVSRETISSGESYSSAEPIFMDERSRSGKMHLPIWLGMLWNVLVLFFWAIFIAAGILAVVAPPPQNQEIPVAVNAALAIGLVGCCCSAIAFALLDKRLLRKAFAKRAPRFANSSRKQLLKDCILLFAIGIVIAFVASFANVLLESF